MPSLISGGPEDQRGCIPSPDFVHDVLPLAWVLGKGIHNYPSKSILRDYRIYRGHERIHEAFLTAIRMGLESRLKDGIRPTGEKDCRYFPMAQRYDPEFLI